MATAQATISVRDLLTPVLANIGHGLAASVQVAEELARRLDALERELARLRWEQAWALATGRPWGWKPRLARVDALIDTRFPMASMVEVDGALLMASRADVQTNVRESVLSIDLPLGFGANVRFRRVCPGHESVVAGVRSVWHCRDAACQG